MTGRVDDGRAANGEIASSLVSGALHLTEALVEIEESPDFLGRLNHADRKRVIERGRRRIYTSGQAVFRQGELHDGIYVIEQGLVRSFYLAASGREITLAYWTPGHFVGGPEIFGGGSHMWTSTALKPSQCLWLPGKELKALCKEVPDLAIGLIEGLVHKGKCYSALLQLLATTSMSKRLARLLTVLADRHGTNCPGGISIDVPFSHAQLANMIGATRQWVSISLERFERDGLLRRESRNTVVLTHRLLKRSE